MHIEIFPYNYYKPELYYETNLGSISEAVEYTDSTHDEFK